MSGSDFRVSVAIPAHNEAQRIRAALESVLAQTESPAEILVVDDGSTDGTGALAASLGARVVTQPNAGIARTRNRLLTEARFPWLAFLDADDRWLPEKLAWMRRAHEATPSADFLFADVRCVRESGGLATASVFATTPQYAAMPKSYVAPDVVALDRRALAVGNFVGTSSVTVRREALVARGCAFDETLPATADVFVAEDVEWYLRVLRETDAVAVTRVLAEYRWRDGSLSANYGRVRYGDVKLGERVIADPEAYVAGAPAAFAAERRNQLRHAARIYAGGRDFVRAQTILREAQRAGNDPRDALAIALLGLAQTRGGRVAFEALRRVRARSRAV